MKIMVTGALGNVGGYVASYLIEMNQEVVVADMDLQKLEKRYGTSVDSRLFDFMDPETYEKVLEGVDRVFVMRPPHIGNPEDMYPFIEKMKEKDIQLVSFLSLMGIENNTIPPHYKIEKKIEAVGLPYAHIRPGFFMQNVSGVHSVEIREKNQIFVPAGRSTTMFVDAADVGLAAATVLANHLDHQNTAYTISGPKAMDYNEIADILTDITGRKITYAKPGFLKYRHQYRKVRGLEAGYVNVTMALYLMTRLDKKNKKPTRDFEELTGQQHRDFRTFAEAAKDAFMRA